jgi:hypothetical protein
MFKKDKNYEEELSLIKKEHFNRVKNLEDQIHSQRGEINELKLQLNTKIKELEHKYKLDVQEIISENEKKLKQKDHEVSLVMEKWNLEKSRIENDHKTKLMMETQRINDKATAELRSILEREGQSKDFILNQQANFIEKIRQSIPNVNWARKETKKQIQYEKGSRAKSKRVCKKVPN